MAFADLIFRIDEDMKRGPIMRKRSGFTLVELMIVVAIIGILATIAIPDFLKLQAKSKQAEAKMNLGAIYTAEIAYYAEASTYAGGNVAFQLLRWEPESVNVTRYAYLIDNSMIAPLFHPPATLPSPPPVSASSFTVYAAGNIDTDLLVDVWTINDARILKNTYSDIHND